MAKKLQAAGESGVGLTPLLGRFVSRDDDREPISEKWLVSLGAEWSEQQYHWEFGDETWPLFLWRSKSGPWSATIDKTPWPCDLWTRGCLIRLLLALQRDL